MKNKYFEDLNQFHKEFYNKEENALTFIDLSINYTKAKSRESVFLLSPEACGDCSR